MGQTTKTKTTLTLEPFKIEAADPLAGEHRQLAKLLVETKPHKGSWYGMKLAKCEAYAPIADADRDASLRYLRACVAQLRHNDGQRSRVLAQAKDELDRANFHHLPGGMDSMHVRWVLNQAAESLLKRKLPYAADDLARLCEWIAGSTEGLNCYTHPLKSIARVLAAQPPEILAEAGVGEAARAMVAAMRKSAGYDRDVPKLADQIERLFKPTGGDEEGERPTPIDAELFVPVPAGDPRTFVALKRGVGIPVDAVEATTEPIGPDLFPLRADSPYAAEHAAITAWLAATSVAARRYRSEQTVKETAEGRALIETSQADGGRMLMAALERSHFGQSEIYNHEAPGAYDARQRVASLAEELFANVASLPRDALFDALLYLTATHDTRYRAGGLNRLDAQLLALEPASLTPGERHLIHRLRCLSFATPPLGDPPEPVRALGALLGEPNAGVYLVPGEPCADAINADLASMKSAKKRDAWVELLRHAQTATSSRPTAKWTATAKTLMKPIAGDFAERLPAWLALFNRDRSIRLVGHGGYGDIDLNGGVDEGNATILRGLLWCAPLLADTHAVTRAIGNCTVAAYRKIRGVGPRATKVGNACVYALSAIGDEAAVGQLALLKVKVKFGTAQKEIEKAFDAAAAKLGLPRDGIEELGVPTYGMDEVGLRRETFGEGDAAVTATLRVDGKDVSLTWTKADGKALKSVPAKVKSEFKDELKDLQAAAKDAGAMVAAQAERIDGLFLAQRSWPVERWRERYLDHPLVGTVARRLIWLVGGTPAIWHDGKLVGADDRPVEPAAGAGVELWHPIARPQEEVLAWRAWLTRHEVRQPFKQAHREVYVLTDAERRTNTYSNRFAAHVLRQHQFNALCAARGWKNRLRLMVDDEYPPATKQLPRWNLRAEYWVEGIGDDYGTDTTDSGAYVRLSTDQVRFYRAEAADNSAHAGGGGYGSRAAGPGAGDLNAPLPLEQIPPLVLSEVMRDVDLFVGVASVGNDPTWQDGGPAGRYRDYWQSYSFGDLGETAKTRRAVLETLLPRLTKLKGKWTLDERFLVVQGSLRRYKIHLGSGNILMEPNDEYLCIVADRSAARGDGDVFLPFEGDATLSIILSKAFLLAADEKITDATITRQIKRK